MFLGCIIFTDLYDRFGNLGLLKDGDRVESFLGCTGESVNKKDDKSDKENKY